MSRPPSSTLVPSPGAAGSVRAKRTKKKTIEYYELRRDDPSGCVGLRVDDEANIVFRDVYSDRPDIIPIPKASDEDYQQYAMVTEASVSERLRHWDPKEGRQCKEVPDVPGSRVSRDRGINDTNQTSSKAGSITERPSISKDKCRRIIKWSEESDRAIKNHAAQRKSRSASSSQRSSAVEKYKQRSAMKEADEYIYYDRKSEISDDGPSREGQPGNCVVRHRASGNLHAMLDRITERYAGEKQETECDPNGRSADDVDSVYGTIPSEY